MDNLDKIKSLLVVITIILSFAAFYFARDLFLPIIIGLMLALTLSPVVRGLARWGIPEPLSAFVLIFGAGFTLAATIYFMSGPVTQLMADAPSMGVELERKLRGLTNSLQQVQDASDQVESIASGGDATPTVAIEQPGLLAFAAGSIANFLGLTAAGMILSMFILASGDLFYVKLVEAFPNFSDKRRAIGTARNIERQISHYFLMITIINAGLGVSIATAMYFSGMPSPLLWGILAFALNFLPFVGAIIGAGIAAAVGILSFDTLGAGLTPAAIYLVLTSIEGQFVTPNVLGRRLEMNTVSVFLTVIIWSWLWGVPGALMSVPMLVLFKTICDGTPGLETVGNFLGPRKTIVVDDPS